MNTRIMGILERIRKKEHHQFRQEIEWDMEYAPIVLSSPAEIISAALAERMELRLAAVLSQEKPVIFKDEQIVFMRTVKTLPPLFRGNELQELRENYFLHEQGFVCNICPDYASVIASGLSHPAVLDLCDRYAQAAEDTGLDEIAERLRRVPANGAESFLDALQMFRILHFTLWCEGEYHNTIGRFDQFMLPYLQRDLAEGSLTEEAAFELLLEFFITFNKDSDLYPGVQQGDNGQSLMLGGGDFNILSEMCLRASRELKLIDPKINLRVNKNTPLSVYELGTELTRVGLGFPQYSNDDVVIPGLIDLGYEAADARNYTVAACWEFIIPGLGFDIPNIGALSFPAVVDSLLHRDFKSFDELLDAAKAEIIKRCNDIMNEHKNLFVFPAPFMSTLMGCEDISQGAKYNNYGIHGTGLATAADSLAALRKIVWEEGQISFREFADHVKDDFKGAPELLARLRYEMPKMGQNNDEADEMAIFLLNSFAGALRGKKTERGGIYRAGTGSAMYYLWHAGELGASPDGRRHGEMFPANYAPSLFAMIEGPFSVIQSFTKPDLRSAINGGPLTMEFHEDLFKSPDSIRKIAMLVKSFMDAGGHQMQLNTVNRETLLEAQKEPGKYPNLIVRVWGWSAYFVELDKDYQDHVIARQEHTQ